MRSMIRHRYLFLISTVLVFLKMCSTNFQHWRHRQRDQQILATLSARQRQDMGLDD